MRGCRFDCAMYASEWIELLPAYICVMMLFGFLCLSVCLSAVTRAVPGWFFSSSMTL